MKTHNEAKWRRLVKESRMDEMATAWKKRGLAGPYKLKSGEMGGPLATLEQYVTPEGELPTHFIHFGGVTEQDVIAVKKEKHVSYADAPEHPGYTSWEDEPTLGPAKSVAIWGEPPGRRTIPYSVWDICLPPYSFYSSFSFRGNAALCPERTVYFIV